MLWTEKYRPQKLDEIVGQGAFISDDRDWGEGMPNLLLYGPAGVGKTASAGVLANMILGDAKAGNFFEINASDDRRLEVVRTTMVRKALESLIDCKTKLFTFSDDINLMFNE